MCTSHCWTGQCWTQYVGNILVASCLYLYFYAFVFLLIFGHKWCRLQTSPLLVERKVWRELPKVCHQDMVWANPYGDFFANWQLSEFKENDVRSNLPRSVPSSILGRNFNFPSMLLWHVNLTCNWVVFDEKMEVRLIFCSPILCSLL